MTNNNNAEEFTRIMHQALSQHKTLETQLLSAEDSSGSESQDDKNAEEFADATANLLSASRGHGTFFADSAGRPITEEQEYTPPTREELEKLAQNERARQHKAQSLVNACDFRENLYQATGM